MRYPVTGSSGRIGSARTARKRHLDGVRILADLLRAPHEIVHPTPVIASELINTRSPGVLAAQQETGHTHRPWSAGL